LSRERGDERIRTPSNTIIIIIIIVVAAAVADNLTPCTPVNKVRSTVLRMHVHRKQAHLDVNIADTTTTVFCILCAQYGFLFYFDCQ